MAKFLGLAVSNFLGSVDNLDPTSHVLVVYESNIPRGQNTFIKVARSVKEKSDIPLQTMATSGKESQLMTLMKAPEIVEEYGLVIPVSAVRSRIRQEFERHRYVRDLSVIDLLIFKGTSEFQVTLVVVLTDV
jgi:hypothetical protein